MFENNNKFIRVFFLEVIFLFSFVLVGALFLVSAFVLFELTYLEHDFNQKIAIIMYNLIPILVMLLAGVVGFLFLDGEKIKFIKYLNYSFILILTTILIFNENVENLISERYYSNINTSILKLNENVKNTTAYAEFLKDKDLNNRERIKEYIKADKVSYARVWPKYYVIEDLVSITDREELNLIKLLDDEKYSPEIKVKIKKLTSKDFISIKEYKELGIFASDIYNKKITIINP